MDKIRIKDLEVFCNHGVFPEETKLGQKFLVSAVLYTDTREAGFTDDLTKSINYGDVCHMIKNFMVNNTYKLIETVCEEMASHLLRSIPNLMKVDIEVKKPWAPIGLPLKEVSVQIERQWHTAYIALGSNLGDKEKFLNDAVEALNSNEDIRVSKISSFLITEPYGGIEQDNFLNGCIEIKTLLTPLELLKVLNETEAKAGRERIIHWGPRTLDLDIIFYDNEVIDDEKLTVPHKEMQLRDFVLKPLAEIAPKKRHPILNKTVEELLEEIQK